MVWAFLVAACGLIWPFLFCHFGTIATERLQSFDIIAYNANWFDYPSDLRKFIILITAQSRTKINFNGLGLIGCNLEIFGKVRRLIELRFWLFDNFSDPNFISCRLSDRPVRIIWFFIVFHGDNFTLRSFTQKSSEFFCRMKTEKSFFTIFSKWKFIIELKFLIQMIYWLKMKFFLIVKVFKVIYK